MNNLNSLENHLRAWKLREPSLKLQEKILSAPAPAVCVTKTEWQCGNFLRWLLPVAGCFALLVSGVNHRDQGVQLLASTNTMLGIYSTGTPASSPHFQNRVVQCEQNNIPSQRLEWAVSNHSQSFIPQNVFVSDTNHLIQ